MGSLSDSAYYRAVVRRPGERDQTSEGDWTLPLDRPQAPNLTVELETADLKELSQQGYIQPMTVELSTLDIEEINTGKTVAEIGRIVGESSSIIVDLREDELAAPTLVPRAPTNPVASMVPTPLAVRAQTSPNVAVRAQTNPNARAQTTPDSEVDGGGAWLVVVVYLASAAALAISVYLRFFV